MHFFFNYVYIYLLFSTHTHNTYILKATSTYNHSSVPKEREIKGIISIDYY
jgi:hypothetical protein